MAMGALLDERRNEIYVALNTPDRCIVHDSERTIYTLMLDVVRKKHPSFVLSLFKDLFINLVNDANSIPSQEIQKIISANNEEEFKNTLKRCCYILVNNWEAARQYQAVKELIEIFNDTVIDRRTDFDNLTRLRRWLNNFKNSQDYAELKIYALKREDQEQKHWSHRYTSYLLAPQYMDRSNPIEQRKVAKTLAKELKEKFKLDLAMYTARAASNSSEGITVKNPTGLGDKVINLIKIIVAKRGEFNYVNLANIFIQQTQGLTYKKFKYSLNNYLTFSIGDNFLKSQIKAKLDRKLNTLYDNYDEEIASKLIIGKTCDRLVEYLTTEDNQSPSELFLLLMFQKTPLTLVILLLKVVLICKPSRLRLEACIADLIRYYEEYPEDECKWVIKFVDIFNIAFTIYAEDVEYNLIKMTDNNGTNSVRSKGEDYRVFSQIKGNQKL